MRSDQGIVNNMLEYTSSNDILADICGIIDNSRRFAYRAVDTVLVIRNWYIGKRIAEEELKGDNRAEYGAEIIKNLSEKLTENYGKGFNKRTVYKFLQFYRYFPGIVPTVTAQSDGKAIVPTPTAQLSWSHYEKLLQVNDENARNWYANEAYTQAWGVRTLQRNISSQYYYRILRSQSNVKLAHRKYIG